MSSEGYIRYGILTFRWFNCLAEGYLLFRQHRVYKTKTQVPNELKEIFPADTYKRARLYNLDHNYDVMCGKFASPVIETLTFWWSDGLRRMWEYAGAVVRGFGLQQDELIQSAVFVFVLITFYQLFQSIDNYHFHFVFEEEHGFNRQTLKRFIVDEVKKIVLLQALLVPFSTGLVYIIKSGGDYLFLYLWLYVLTAISVDVIIYLEFTAPLFDKYTPLPNGELRTRIERLAVSVEFPASNIYVVEESKRSAHTNAYFFWYFWNRRIVLYDTLLKHHTSTTGGGGERIGCDDDEVLGIVAHELGHWKLHHVLKEFFILQTSMFLEFFCFAALFRYDTLFHAFGFRKEKPAIVGIIVVLALAFSPYLAVRDFCLTCLSRRFELQADAFAKHLGMGAYLRRGLIKVEKDNLSFPVYDGWYSLWYKSHPPLLQRLQALDDD